MVVYYVIFLILSISAFMTEKKQSFAIIGYCIFSILYIFEARVGSDYSSYQIYYSGMNSFDNLSAGGFEIGYNLMALVFHKMGLPFQFFHVCVFATIDTLLYRATRRLDLEIGLTALLALFYVFYPSLEAMRQGIAISIFLYSLTYIIPVDNAESAGDVKYFSINLVAFMIHRSAIITFAFYFFRKFRVVKIGTICALAFFAAIQPFLMEFLHRFPAFYYRYYYYVWSRSVETQDVTVLSVKLLEYIIVSLILILRHFINELGITYKGGKLTVPNRKSKQTQLALHKAHNQLSIDLGPLASERRLNEIESLSLDLVGLGLIIQVFLTPIIATVYRLVYYCDLGIIMFYVTMLQRIRNKSLKYLFILFIVLYVGFRLWRVFPFDDERFIYHFVF